MIEVERKTTYAWERHASKYILTFCNRNEGGARQTQGTSCNYNVTISGAVVGLTPTKWKVVSALPEIPAWNNHNVLQPYISGLTGAPQKLKVKPNTRVSDSGGCSGETSSGKEDDGAHKLEGSRFSLSQLVQPDGVKQCFFGKYT